MPTSTSPLGVADSLTIRSEAAAAVGSELLAGGMASYRVKVAMSRTARALGLDSFTSIVTYTDITATATLNGRYRTRITQPGHVGVDVDHLYRTQRMVETLPERGTSAADVFEALARIKARRPLYSRPVNALAAGIACAAFAFLNQAGPTEILAVRIAATLGQAVRRVFQLRQWTHLLIPVIAAVVTACLYLTMVGVPVGLGWIPPGNLGGYMAAVLFLVPGFPMITGVLDLVRSDFSAGMARLTYSGMIILGAAAAIWTVSIAAGVDAQPATPLGLPFALELPLRALATFLGVLGFAIIFNSPWKIAVAAAAVSTVANSLRFLMTEGGVPVQLATLAATVLVGVTAYVIARIKHVPRISISVPAVVIMIPGYAMYTGFTMLNAGELAESVLLLQEAVQTVLAAAFGLALAHLATSPAWRRVHQPT
ncbi:threonine/serine exporter family protein [Brachybacterium sp. Marseille-Q2903]|uniref:Threonine/serine exporter family protein n=1 Tax=Brachybacterium epidermidis TaxID=2781983 RepID=A0ABR9W034_9MICO|nr:threonine/serine exporter family protein [Brachybacterium epidermidis]